MKTITLKADEHFDATLSRLAKRLNTTKSAVIREAVGDYERRLEREELGRLIREASLKTRAEATRAASDFEAADADGL
jgi:predicted transcriptional regulator